MLCSSGMDRMMYLNELTGGKDEVTKETVKTQDV